MVTFPALPNPPDQTQDFSPFDRYVDLEEPLAEGDMYYGESPRMEMHISEDPMYLMLREGCIKDFNAKKGIHR